MARETSGDGTTKKPPKLVNA